MIIHNLLCFLFEAILFTFMWSLRSTGLLLSYISVCFLNKYQIFSEFFKWHALFCLFYILFLYLEKLQKQEKGCCWLFVRPMLHICKVGRFTLKVCDIVCCLIYSVFLETIKDTTRHDYGVLWNPRISSLKYNKPFNTVQTNVCKIQ